MFINIHVYLFSILKTFFQTCSVKRFFCYLGLLILEGCLLQNPSHAGRRRPRGRCQHLGVGSARAHKELAAFTAHHVRPPDHMSNDLRITPATIQTSGSWRDDPDKTESPTIPIYIYICKHKFLYIHIFVFTYNYFFFHTYIFFQYFYLYLYSF